jgi:RNA polymerase sigma-32 factor
MSTGEADPSEQVAREQLQDLLKEKIAAFATGLSERDRYILEARMVAEEPVTLQAIGDKFGTTREAVRQAEARLVKKLKEFLRTEIKGIEDFDVQAD